MESGIYFNNNDLKSLTSTVEDITSRNAIDVYLKQKEHIKKYEIDKVIPSWISLYSQI